MLMLPGGKPESSEDARDTAIREFSEELGSALDPLLLRFLGEFEAPAANEPGFSVVASVYEHPFVAAVVDSTPQSEIEHIEWVDPASARSDIAPLNTEIVFPLLRACALPRVISRIAVFTGSSAGKNAHSASAAAEIGAECAARNIGLVYGGGHVGLMGTVADAAMSAGGEVFGVIPQLLVHSELSHTAITRLEVVADMHTRKHRMASLTDAFVALPGGLGTLEELFEVWTWLNLGLHDKPVALYDVDGYWKPLLALIDSMVDQGFVSEPQRASLIVASTPEDLFAQLSAWQAPQRKWATQ